jgi:uncharacterized protein YjbI with pentapeptide repeats
LMQLLKERISKGTDIKFDPKIVWINPWKYKDKESLRTAIIGRIFSLLPADLLGDLIKNLSNVCNIALCTFLEFFGAGKTLSGLSKQVEITAPEKDMDEIIQESISRFVKKQEKGKKLQKPSLITVFIDDLDRCHPDVISEVLETVKLYLDIPYCVFILGFDLEKVTYSIGKELTKSFDSEYNSPKEIGYEYIRKIFSSIFPIPIAGSERFKTYVEKCLKKAGIIDTEKEMIVSDITTWSKHNPRLVKKIINGYIGRHEFMGEKKMGSNPLLLIKLTVINVKWPSWFKWLIENFEITEELFEHINSGKKLNELNERGFALPTTNGSGVNEMPIILLQEIAKNYQPTELGNHLFNELSLSERLKRALPQEQGELLLSTLLSGNVNDFNSFREEVPSYTINFPAYTKLPKGIVLDGINFSNCVLKEISFEQVSLIKADFSNAVMESSSFAGSFLDGAIFKNANLKKVIFVNASVARADFSGARNFSSKQLQLTIHKDLIVPDVPNGEVKNE